MSIFEKLENHKVYAELTGTDQKLKMRQEIEGLLEIVNNHPIPYISGRQLIDYAFNENDTELVEKLLLVYDWQDIHEFEDAKWGESKGEKYFSFIRYIGNDTSDEMVSALIDGGELNFISLLTVDRLIDGVVLKARKFLEMIYENTKTTRHFPLIMTEMDNWLQVNGHGCTLNDFAEKGFFDGDNQSAYKRWLISDSVEPAKRTPVRM